MRVSQKQTLNAGAAEAVARKYTPCGLFAQNNAGRNAGLRKKGNAYVSSSCQTGRLYADACRI